MVTLSKLDRLVRLADRQVQGAAEQLAAYRLQEPVTVADLLGIPVDALASRPSELVDQVRAARQRARSSRAHKRAAQVASLARRLEDTAVIEDDHFVLDPGVFLDLVTTASSGTLVFDVEGQAGGIEMRFLRRLARACQGTVVHRLELHGSSLLIRYTAGGARGFYRLLLHPGASSEPVFVVQLGPTPDPPAAAQAPEANIWDHLLDAVGRAA